MLEFRTFEDVLDFAILQEKTAQLFYNKLCHEVLDPELQRFYQILVDQEAAHEMKLHELKRGAFELEEPSLESLANSGYLDSMPARPDMTYKEAVSYALKKEKSAMNLYSILSTITERKELRMLFDMLSREEAEHVAFFEKLFEEVCLGMNGNGQ